MHVISNFIGLVLVIFGLDGVFNEGHFSQLLITTNHDVSMTMLVSGALVLAVGLCLCEFGDHSKKKPQPEEPIKAQVKEA